MTVKEIAKAVGKDSTIVTRWIQKILHMQNACVDMQNACVHPKNLDVDPKRLGVINSIKEKAGSKDPHHPADYDFEETLLIIEAGIGPDAAGVYRASAAKQESPAATKIDFSEKRLMAEILVDAFKAGGITNLQLQAMIGAPVSGPNAEYFNPRVLLPARKKAEKADRLEEIRQEVEAFVERHIEFTGKWHDVIKEHEMYAIFKDECIEKAPIPRYEFTSQLKNYSAMQFGRDKQDTVIWHNIRLK